MGAREYTVLFPFCGLGAGALGFLDAQITMFGAPAKFRSLGGIDVDRAACADFEMLTKSPALCADVATLTAAELRAFAGDEAPDVVFLSPPCKGFSGLLSKRAAGSVRYRRLNRLVLDWMKVMLDAWATPPRLVLLENVPRIASRGRRLLTAVRGLLRRAGYLFHAETHDCGELGGLAQHRQRYLLVARHPKRVPPLLYKPTTKRVRACGEVLGRLPLPGDPVAGPMHQLPRISWLNWVRLALIPAGGDWRDLPGTLVEGQRRREVFRRHRVEKWTEPTATVAGSGRNGPSAIADPRVDEEARKAWEQRGEKTEGQTHWFKGKYGVQSWEEPSRAVIGGPSNGAAAIADPRLRPQPENAQLHEGKYRVRGWDQPAAAVIGATRVGSGAQSVADPRVPPFGNVNRVTAWDQPVGTITHAPAPSSGGGAVADPRFAGAYGVTGWDQPAGTVTGEAAPSTGRFAVADPRLEVRVAYDHGYGVLRWDEPSSTIAGGSHPGQGAYSVADLRTGSCYRGTFGVMSWQDAAGTITGNARIDAGRFAVADPRKPPPEPVVIIAADGTWHRPLTTLELAALQGMPTEVDGKPLVLHGTSQSAWRERIGNAVPPPTARAVAEQMLVCLVSADASSFALSSGGGVWVDPLQETATT